MARIPLGLRETFQYGTPENPTKETGLIYDIGDGYNPGYYEHLDYDRRYRLIGYQLSADRNGPYAVKYAWSYDRYNNLTGLYDYNDPANCWVLGYCLNQYSVDPATNRLNMITYRTGSSSYTYDAVGNDITGGRTFDAENRLAYAPWSAGAESYLYDGSAHRLRKLTASTKTYYIYSARGMLLVEDNWTEGTTQNQIYFNGQLVATHDQADYVRFYFKDHLGAVRSVVEVTPDSYNWATNWQTISVFGTYNPFGYITVKETDATGLAYYGTRYYAASTSRWISADAVTPHIYDPASLNKYTYVRNDPINRIDPDGHDSLGASPYLALLIASYETFVDHIYPGPGGSYIGYGHKLIGNDFEKYKNGIIQEDALALLETDLNQTVKYLMPQITAKLTQNQFDAVIDVAYTNGPFGIQDLISAVNKRQVTQDIFAKYNSALDSKTGKSYVVPNLVARRADDWEIWAFGDYGKGPITPGPGGPTKKIVDPDDPYSDPLMYDLFGPSQLEQLLDRLFFNFGMSLSLTPHEPRSDVTWRITYIMPSAD